MKRTPTFEEVARAGFVFPSAREWIMPGNVGRLAQDAALVTTPNTTVPVELTAYIDPKVIEILTAVRNARKLFPEVQKGDWTTSYDKWAAEETTGSTQPYADYANGTTSGVNTQWFAREQYVFQTTINYGDREVAVSAVAKINLASRKQIAAANVIDLDANKFALLGVEGKEIYGILNDPNLPAAGVVTSWASKTSEQIFNDILNELFASLATNSGGHITNSTPLKLAVSPAMNVALGTTNTYGKTVLDMLNQYFSSLEIVVIPELASLEAGDTIVMVAPEVNGMPTAELAYGLKMRAGRVIPDMSSFRQKFVASTYGGIVYQPFAFASITGMDGD